MIVVVDRPGRPSTVGGLVHSAVVVVLLLVIALLALVVTPPSPPGIAEFAPRATETIDEALKQQASQFGTGDGGNCVGGQDCAAGGGLGVTTTTTTTPELGGSSRRVIEEKKVKACVGDPPRQTEDPQSPPCINYWEGDNGGSTSKGVTGEEIRVAIFPQPDTHPAVHRFVSHFNQRYQFYGRLIRLVPMSPGGNDPRAAAAAVDTEADAFAAFDFKRELHNFGNPPLPSVEHYFRELAKRRVIGISSQPRRFTRPEMKKMAPYYWAYDLGIEDMLRHTAALICDSLHDRPARHAGAELQLKRRKFAVLYERMPDDGSIPPLDVLDEGLARCSETAHRYEVSDAVISSRTSRGQQMRQSDITSVIVVANNSVVTGEMAAWANINFEPELIQSGYNRTDHESQYQLVADAPRRSSMFGIGVFNRLNPMADEPAMWAEREGDPSYNENHTRGESFYAAYHALLLLASGIQLAGPNLTPTTFAEGLAKARFPNPLAGAAPYWQAHVGFGPDDYTMVDDVTLVWWDETAPSYRGVSATSGWCYVDRGARSRTFRRPSDTDSRFFQPGTCR